MKKNKKLSRREIRFLIEQSVMNEMFGDIVNLAGDLAGQATKVGLDVAGEVLKDPKAEEVMAGVLKSTGADQFGISVFKQMFPKSKVFLAYLKRKGVDETEFAIAFGLVLFKKAAAEGVNIPKSINNIDDKIADIVADSVLETLENMDVDFGVELFGIKIPGSERYEKNKLREETRKAVKEAIKPVLILGKSVKIPSGIVREERDRTTRKLSKMELRKLIQEMSMFDPRAARQSAKEKVQKRTSPHLTRTGPGVIKTFTHTYDPKKVQRLQGLISSPQNSTYGLSLQDTLGDYSSPRGEGYSSKQDIQLFDRNMALGELVLTWEEEYAPNLSKGELAILKKLVENNGTDLTISVEDKTQSTYSGLPKRSPDELKNDVRSGNLENTIFYSVKSSSVSILQELKMLGQQPPPQDTYHRNPNTEEAALDYLLGKSNPESPYTSGGRVPAVEKAFFAWLISNAPYADVIGV